VTPTPTPLEAATFIVKLLREQGHVAYFAGGCVRDALLGLKPKDYDVATDAPPAKVASIFRNTQFVGEAFGVTLVKLKGFSVEVATFRKEWGYTDGRHPSHVEFSTAEQDAQRRDFTINGLFENPLATSEQDRIIDYVGGVADLKAGIIRAIGKPEDRFSEDYLRMLRAVRFASRFGFAIEEATANAIRHRAPYLGQISRERIGQEVQTMLSQPYARASTIRLGGCTLQGGSRKALAAVQHLSNLNLDGPVLTEESMNIGLPILSALDDMDSPAVDYPARLLGWMLDRHCSIPGDGSASPDSFTPLRIMAAQKAEDVIDRWRRALVLSNGVTSALTDTLACMVRALEWSDMSVAQRKRLLAMPAWPRALAVLTARGYLPDTESLVRHIRQDTHDLAGDDLAPPPLLNGGDLIKMGQKPGPAFRRLLDEAYDEQLEGRLTSRQEALKWLENLIKKQ